VVRSAAAGGQGPGPHGGELSGETGLVPGGDSIGQRLGLTSSDMALLQGLHGDA
jgi:hypothetical protein